MLGKFNKQKIWDMKNKPTTFVENSFINDSCNKYHFHTDPYRYLLHLLYAVRHHSTIPPRALLPVYLPTHNS